MTKEKIKKKMLMHDKRKKIWLIIFYASVILGFLTILIDKWFDYYNNNVLLVIAVVVGFSFCFLIHHHFGYKNSYNKLLKLNNVDTKVFESVVPEKKHLYTMNYVLEGKYKNKKVTCGTWLYIDSNKLNKNCISSYNVIDETDKSHYSVWKGTLGVVLLGGVGAIAGINGKKRKEYLVAIEWKSGEKSLILIDNEYYKVFVKSMF